MDNVHIVIYVEPEIADGTEIIGVTDDKGVAIKLFEEHAKRNSIYQNIIWDWDGFEEDGTFFIKGKEEYYKIAPWTVTRKNS